MNLFMRIGRYLLIFVSVFLVSCQQPNTSVSISYRLGYFPQHMYNHTYSLHVRSYSVSGSTSKLLNSQNLGSVTPASADVRSALTTNKSANYIGAYLFAPYNTSYPDYFMEWKITGTDENSNTNHFWWNYENYINNKISFGITDKMLTDVEYNTTYKLDFYSQPYYLFRINTTGISSLKTIISSLSGGVETASMQDVSNFWMWSYGRSSIAIGSSTVYPSGNYYYYLYVPENYTTQNSVILKYTNGSSASGNIYSEQSYSSRNYDKISISDTFHQVYPFDSVGIRFSIWDRSRN